MNGFVLLTASGCHLCEHGRDVLDELGLEWREVTEDSEEGGALASAAPPLRPVLFGDHGRVVAYGRLSRRRLERVVTRPRLRAARSPR